MSYPAEFVAGNQLTAAEVNDYTMNPVFTIGESITATGAPKAVYIKASDSKVYKASAATQAHVDGFIGFVVVDGVLNDPRRVFGPGKVVSGLSGLTVGAPVYLGDTAGAISATSGTIALQIGVALSATSMLVTGFKTKTGQGDGSDGALNFDGSSTVLGISPGGGVYTLTRDIFGTTITLSGSGTIVITNGYAVYATVGIVRSAGSNAKFQYNGNNGGNATNSVGAVGTVGAAGAAPSAGSLPGGIAGVAGGLGMQASSGGPSNQKNGDNGTSGPTKSATILIGNGVAGGAGGNSQASGNWGYGGSGGGGGTSTQTKKMPRRSYTADALFEFSSGSLVIMNVSGASGGGAGGGAAAQGSPATSWSGCGGGSASTGCILYFAAPFISDLGTGTMFETKGGIGGYGGNASGNSTQNQAAGGGGGGAGGNGGVIIRSVSAIFGIATTDVTGGAGGAGGTGWTYGSASKTDGSTGTIGNNGLVIDIIN